MIVVVVVVHMMIVQGVLRWDAHRRSWQVGRWVHASSDQAKKGVVSIKFETSFFKGAYLMLGFGGKGLSPFWGDASF